MCFSLYATPWGEDSQKLLSRFHQPELTLQSVWMSGMAIRWREFPVGFAGAATEDRTDRAQTGWGQS